MALLALWLLALTPRSVCALSLVAACMAARSPRVPPWVAVPRCALLLACPFRCRLLLALPCPRPVDLTALLPWLPLALVLLLAGPLA